MKSEAQLVTGSVTNVDAILPMTRAQLLDDIATMFRTHLALRFNTIVKIEYKHGAELRETPVAGTMFESIVTRLNFLGVPTENNLGGIMDSLELTETDAHDLGCACLGATVNGATVMGRVERLKHFR